MDASGLTLNRSTIEERNSKLYYTRVLYLLLALQLGLVLLWAHWLSGHVSGAVGRILSHWGFTLAVGLICLLLILLCYFLSIVRRDPINWVIYVLFTILFALFVGSLAAKDRSGLVGFVLWVLFFVAIALFLYFLVAETYIPSLTEVLLIFGVAGLALLFFLATTDIEPWKLSLALVIAIAISFFISYQHRSMLRNSLWDLGREDPVTGAVRIWFDGLLGFCRIGELFTKGLGRFAI